MINIYIRNDKYHVSKKGGDLMDIQISQDIRKFKTKDLGNFNFKEIGFIAMAAAVGVAAYKFLNLSIDESAFCAVPVLIFGFLKPFGLSFWQFFRTFITEEFLAPRSYYNETDFVYDPDELEELIGDKIDFPEGYNEKDVSPEYKQPKENLKELIR